MTAPGCTCYPVPEKYWTTHYGAVEPGSMMEPNPDCLVHFPAVTAEQPGLWDDTGWALEAPPVDPAHVTGLDRLKVRTGYTGLDHMQAPLPIPDLDGLFDQIATYQAQAAADQRLVEELAVLLETNTDRTQGLLVYRDSVTGEWEIIQSPFIPVNRIHLVRSDGLDLMVERSPDGVFQGRRETPKLSRPGSSRP